MLKTTSGKEHKDIAVDVKELFMSNLINASLYNVVDADVVVIGGALLDIVYQPQITTTCVSSMYGTSTPCRLARMASGGVGRNIAEAIARLGTRVVFRTIIGGGEQAEPKRGIRKNNKNKRGAMNIPTFDACCPEEEQTTANSSVEPLKKALSSRVAQSQQQQKEQPPDTNGRLLLEEMRRLELDTDFLFNISTEVVANASSATYMALLDGKGELAAAAGVVDLFEKHFSAQIALDVFEKPFSDLCENPSDSMSSATFDDDEKDATVITNEMASRQNGGEPSIHATRRKVKVNPFSVKWVVIDGNVAQETLEGVCAGVQTLNNEIIKSKKAKGQKVSCSTAEGQKKEQQHQKDERIRIAYDPISKTQGLRCLNVLNFIDIMKPNIYECITIAFALCEKQIIIKDGGRRGGGRRKHGKGVEKSKSAAGDETKRQDEERDHQCQAVMKEDDDSPDTLSAARLSIHIHALVRTWEEKKKSMATKESRGDVVAVVVKEEDLKAGASEEEKESETQNQQQHAILHRFGDLEFASLKTMTLAHDQTFCEIVALTIASSSSDVGGEEKDEKREAGDRVFSPAATLFWELFEHLSPADQEIIGLLSAMFLVVEGGVGQILCSLGESGCWVVGSNLQKKNGAADVREHYCGAVTVRKIPSIAIPPDNALVKVTGAGDSFLGGYLCGLLALEAKLENSQDSKREGEREMQDTSKGCGSGSSQCLFGDNRGDHNIGSLLRLSEIAQSEGWLLPERAAALAALSSLLSDETINPCILEFVADDHEHDHNDEDHRD